MIRPEYHGERLLVEFCGDHRANGFPNVSELLQRNLGAVRLQNPKIDEVTCAVAMDKYISYWTCAAGNYEIDDDTWGLFIAAEENNAQVISAVEQVLVHSGFFSRQDVDYAKYA